MSTTGRGGEGGKDVTDDVLVVVPWSCPRIGRLSRRTPLGAKEWMRGAGGDGKFFRRDAASPVPEVAQ